MNMLKYGSTFNDNFIFEQDEIVIDDYIIGEGQGSGIYTDTINLVILEGMPLGEHIMRVKTNWNNSVPDDACASTNYGETEDYKVNVVLQTGMAMLPEMNSSLKITPIGGKQFEVSFISEKLNEQVVINLHNSLGINLIENKVTYADRKYSYQIDMSYAAPGFILCVWERINMEK